MDEAIAKSLPTPDELMYAPELAVLRVLQTTLEVAEVTLMVSYPGGVEGADTEGGPTEPETYARVMLCQIEALDVLIHEYGQSVKRSREWRERDRHHQDAF